jgi:hypothetical protein
MKMNKMTSIYLNISMDSDNRFKVIVSDEPFSGQPQHTIMLAHTQTQWKIALKRFFGMPVVPVINYVANIRPRSGKLRAVCEHVAKHHLKNFAIDAKYIEVFYG